MFRYHMYTAEGKKKANQTDMEMDIMQWLKDDPNQRFLYRRGSKKVWFTFWRKSLSSGIYLRLQIKTYQAKTETQNFIWAVPLQSMNNAHHTRGVTDDLPVITTTSRVWVNACIYVDQKYVLKVLYLSHLVRKFETPGDLQAKFPKEISKMV